MPEIMRGKGEEKGMGWERLSRGMPLYEGKIKGRGSKREEKVREGKTSYNLGKNYVK